MDFVLPPFHIIPPGQDITLKAPNGAVVQAPAMYFLAAFLHLLQPQELNMICSEVVKLMQSNLSNQRKTATANGPNGQVIMR